MRWIADALLQCFQWLVSPLSWLTGRAIEGNYKGLQVFGLGMAGFGLAGVTTWACRPLMMSGAQAAFDAVASGLSWVPDWVGFIGRESLSLDWFLADGATYLAALSGAYALRVSFSALRATLDVI